MVPFILYRLKKLRYRLMDYGRLAPSLNCDKNATAIIAEMLETTLQDRKILVFLSKQEDEQARQIMMAYKEPIVLHITSLTSKNQEWLVENWNELVRQMPGYTFIQVGLDQDEKVEGAVDLRGKTNFREAMALIKYAKSFAGVNSAFSHVTNAFDIPGVVLFGASNPLIWGHPNNINIYKSFRCAPCVDLLLKSPCPYNKPCMTSITVAEVKHALLMQLNKATPANQQEEPIAPAGKRETADAN
jgi:ADP-heptose:LPS heptosyltransferase